MAAIRVNPTRMELLRLRKRASLAQRGHKLLKEKRDGLMREFLKIVREVRALRHDVDQQLSGTLQHFTLAQASMLPQAVHVLSHLQLQSVSLQVRTRNIMGVQIPEFDISQQKSDGSYPLWETSPELDVALATFNDLLPKLLELAAKEKAVELLAQEIEKTRRRVNALEHVLIPRLKETIRYIRMKLEEQERAAIVTVMSLKDVVGQ